MKQEINGMETGLAVFFIILVTYYYLVKINARGSPVFEPRPFIVMGVLAGLAVLARIDALIFIFFLFLDVIWRGWKSQIRGRALLSSTVLFLLFTSLFVLPWLAINKIYFKSFMPVSGQATRFISLAFGYELVGGQGSFPIDQVPLAYYLRVFKFCLGELVAKQPLLGWVELKPWGITLGTLAIFLYCCLCGRRIVHYYRKFHLSRLNFLCAYALVLILVYSFYVLGYWHFWRYCYPVIFLSLIYSGFIIEVFILWFEEASSRRFTPIVTIIIAGCIVISQAMGCYTILTSKEVGQFYRMAEWVNRNTEKDAIIGVFQSGTLGYFADRRFVGLDGVINKDALEAMKKKNIAKYISDQGVNYLMDWPPIMHLLFWRRGGLENKNIKLKLVRRDYFDIYKVEKKSPRG